MRGAAELAQSVERKALNLVVVGSSPTVGAFLYLLFVFEFFEALRCLPFYILSGARKAEASLAQLVARRSHNPKVVSSILTGPVLLVWLELVAALVVGLLLLKATRQDGRAV